MSLQQDGRPVPGYRPATAGSLIPAWSLLGLLLASAGVVQTVAAQEDIQVIHPSVQLRNFGGRVKPLRLTAPEIEALWESEGRSSGRPIGSVAGIVLTPEVGAIFSDRQWENGAPPQGRPIRFEVMLEGQPGPGALLLLQVMKAPDLNPLEPDSWVTVQPWRIDTEKDFQVVSVGSEAFDFITWPDGGIARFRLMVRLATPSPRHVLLQQYDSDGNLVYTTAPHGIVTDIEEDPSLAAKPFLNALDDRFPHFAPTELREQQAETKRYYQAVRVNVGGRQTSLAEAFPTLADFRAYYFSAGGQQYTARYYNRGDLGIARDMHCVFNNARRENACYVANVAPANADGSTLFGSAWTAKRLMTLNARPFATVAMVERMDMPADAAHHTYFVVYDADEKLATGAVQLDNVGYNTFVPGNCMVCHGGSGTYDRSNADLKGAYFLPFDMDAFEYLSEEPGDPESRESLHDVFKGMNNGILAGSFGALKTADMVRAWYRDGGEFDGLALPPGWNGGGEGGRRQDRALYQRVYAKACRTCHISQDRPDEDPGFSQGATWRTPSVYTTLIKDVCQSQHMPNAQQTLRVAWGDYPSARAYLLAHLGLIGGCAPPQ